MGDWESIFKKKGKFFHKPHEDMRKIVKLLKREKVNRVLDLGCGSGRHTVLLAKEGFDIYGMDNAKFGLKHTREWLKELNLNARLKVASCYDKFPFKDNFFDAIISIQVIHHASIKDIKFCISEIERVLKLGGVVFITVPATERNKFHPNMRLIAPRTYIPLDGPEVGLPHYIYSKNLLKKDFKNFKILKLYIKHKHYCLIGNLMKIV